MREDQQFRVEPLEEIIDPSPDGMTQTGSICFRRWYALASFFVDGGFTDITNYV
jgi:hypothetical protein